MFFGTLGVAGRDLEVALDANKTYRVVAERVAGTCQIGVVETDTNIFVGKDAPPDPAGSSRESEGK
jgi:hypothetical protein